MIYFSKLGIRWLIYLSYRSRSPVAYLFKTCHYSLTLNFTHTVLKFMTGNFVLENFAASKFAGRKLRRIETSLCGIFAPRKFCLAWFLPRRYSAHLNSCRESKNSLRIQMLQIHKKNKTRCHVSILNYFKLN